MRDVSLLGAAAQNPLFLFEMNGACGRAKPSVFDRNASANRNPCISKRKASHNLQFRAVGSIRYEFRAQLKFAQTSPNMNNR